MFSHASLTVSYFLVGFTSFTSYAKQLGEDGSLAKDGDSTMTASTSAYPNFKPYAYSAVSEQALKGMFIYSN